MFATSWILDDSSVSLQARKHSEAAPRRAHRPPSETCQLLRPGAFVTRDIRNPAPWPVSLGVGGPTSCPLRAAAGVSSSKRAPPARPTQMRSNSAAYPEEVPSKGDRSSGSPARGSVGSGRGDEDASQSRRMTRDEGKGSKVGAGSEARRGWCRASVLACCWCEEECLFPTVRLAAAGTDHDQAENAPRRESLHDDHD